VSSAGRRLLDWLFSIRARLLVVNLLIVAVPLLGVGFARFYEREMLRSLEHDMIHQAEVLRHALAADAGGLRLGERGELLTAIARHTRMRIRLLGESGELLADSHAAGPPEGPEQPPPRLWDLADVSRSRSAPVPAQGPPPIVDVSQRDEVRRALDGEYGAATRFWDSRDTLYLFSALPIVADGKVAGVVYVTRSTNPVRSAMYRLRTTLIEVLLAALAATVVLSLFLSGTISRPLVRLMRQAERIARGDRSARLKLARRDEIGKLARSVDSMAQKLDERARFVAELSANISHEFKSPLTGIRGAAELLLEGAADDPAARQRFLGNILADADRLDRLVTRLLELSRVEADPAPLETVDYEALVREVAEQSTGGAEVELSYSARRSDLPGRRAHLRSVLQNLIDNAQQHADDGTTIRVRVAAGTKGMLRTTVTNRGPVISEANLERIWERFFTTRSDEGGTGLGLPIVAAVVRAHGGTVSVASSERHGTTFTVELPAAR
jgi:two-component system sensor histidine kinase ChvG